MKQSDRNVVKLFIVGLIFVWVVGSLFLGEWNPLLWSQRIQQIQGGQPSHGPITPAPSYGAVGVFDVETVAYNSLDISSQLAAGTNYNIYWFANRGGWLMLGSGASTSIELVSQDAGYAYAVVEVPSGQNYYVDWSETMAKNPRVVSVDYADPDNDGYKEFMFKVSFANVPKPASGNPKIYFYPYFLAYEKPTLSSPADITGIGTALTTKYIEWYVSFTNVKKGFAIVKVEFTLNTTDTSKLTIKQVNIPPMGVVSGDQFGTPLKGTSTLTWTYSFASNLRDAQYIKYGANQLNKFDFTTQVECQLVTGDKLGLTITIYGLTPSGTLTTLTDTVGLAA